MICTARYYGLMLTHTRPTEQGWNRVGDP